MLKAALAAQRRGFHAKPCNLWTGAKFGTGYGKKWVDGKWMLAHRWAFREHHGYLPAVVRHDCDTPLCVEETHLLPGDQGDNIRDAVERRRYSRMGEKCKRGHSRWGTNSTTGKRRCLECHRINSKERRRVDVASGTRCAS